MQVLSSLSSIPFYAPSAGYAPTNSAEVSAIASAYQVVSATATQLYAGTAYVTSVNDAPLSASRAGNAANASLANSAWYDGTGRLISSLPDSSTVSAIASSYAESAASSKQDPLTFGYNTANAISSIDGSALAGGGGSEADWSAESGQPGYIENKPVPKTLVAGANISISEGVSTLTISAAAGLPASTSADEGKCLVVDSNGDPEWGTGGKTYTGTDGVVVDNVNDTVGLEAPVDLVAGPGIVVDNPDGNTVRVSANTDSFFKELYYNATNTNDTDGKVYALSEPITNFMYAKITVDNMEFTNRPLVYEIDVQHNTTSCSWNSPLVNGNVDNTINLPVCQLQINASGNLVLVARALTYNTYPSPNFTNGDSRGMRVVRVVGIFRIAGGN